MQQRGNLYTFVFATIICLICSVVLALAASSLKPAQDTNARLDIIRNVMIVAGYKKEDIVKKSPQALIKLFDERIITLFLDRDDKEVPNAEADMIEKLAYLKYPATFFKNPKDPKDLKNKKSFEILRIFTKKKELALKAKNKKPGPKTALKDFDPGYKLLFLHRKEAGSQDADAYIVSIAGPGLWDMMYGYIALKPDLNTVKGITFYKHAETPGLGGECEKPFFRDQYAGKTIFAKDGAFKSVAVAKGKYLGGEPEHFVDGMSGATLTGDGITKFVRKDLSKFAKYFKLKRSQTPGDDSKKEPTDQPKQSLMTKGADA